VVGYLRPLKQWNDGKQAEFRDRKAFHAAGDADMTCLEHPEECADSSTGRAVHR
jgi:hypothetical protein